MGRCKACNIPFSDSDFSHLFEDLCSFCRFIAHNPGYYNIREYQFESITETPQYLENYRNTVDKY